MSAEDEFLSPILRRLAEWKFSAARKRAEQAKIDADAQIMAYRFAPRPRPDASSYNWRV